MTPRSYTFGNEIVLSVTFVDATTQQPANPTAVTLLVADPEGDITTYTATSVPTVLNPSTGVYQCVIIPQIPGIWTYRWVGTGAVVAASERQFEVLPSLFEASNNYHVLCTTGNFTLNGNSATIGYS